MREGKVSQAVLDRSVLRVIKNNNDSVLLGPAIGRDASIIKNNDTKPIITDTRTVCVTSLWDIRLEFDHLINHIACCDGVPQSLMVSVCFPLSGKESYLKEIMKTIDAKCRFYNVQIAGGHTFVDNKVELPIVTLSAIARSRHGREKFNASPNQDIVISGWMGLEGTCRAAMNRSHDLLKKLPNYMVEDAKDFSKLTAAYEAAACAYDKNASIVHDAGEGGIFAALWEFAYASDVGIEVDLKKIPVKQETIEVCECLGLNPYEFMSTGAFVIATDNAKELCVELADRKINAVCVGKTTDTNDRILTNDGEIRHLTVAPMDNIWRI